MWRERKKKQGLMERKRRNSRSLWRLVVRKRKEAGTCGEKEKRSRDLSRERKEAGAGGGREKRSRDLSRERDKK